MAGQVGNNPSTGASGEAFELTEHEADLGPAARRGGRFDITGLTGLTPNAQVLVVQKAAAYTGKGTLFDEIEMDSITVAAYVLNSTTIRAHWRSTGPVRGNVKFGYAVSG